MDVVRIADEIVRDLEDDTIEIPKVVFWLVANIPALNASIGAAYKVEDDQTITPELGDSEGTILKYLYLINYYNRLIRSNLQAGAYDVSEVTEGDTTVRRVSRNELAKTLTQAKNALDDRLNRILFTYKQGQTVPYSLSGCHDLLRFYRA